MKELAKRKIAEITKGKKISGEGGGLGNNIKPSLPVGGKPQGKYEVPDPKDPTPIIRQNEAADLFADKGYDVEMLPNKKGGNGYGIKPSSNPDFKIEGEIFDCYTPKANTPIKSISYNVKEKTLSQTKNIVVNLEDSPFTPEDILSNLQKYPIGSLDKLVVIKNGNIIQIYP